MDHSRTPSPSSTNKALGSRIFFPIKVLYSLEAGYLVGWNINDFTTMVMGVVNSEQYTYSTISDALKSMKASSVTNNLRTYCGGTPVVIGYLAAADSNNNLPNMDRQTQDNSHSIWLRMTLDTALPLKIDGSVLPAPVLKSIHCCGVRHATSTQIVLFEEVDSEKLQYYSRMPSGFLSKRETGPFSAHSNGKNKTLGQQNSELDYALHQINSLRVFRAIMDDHLNDRKEMGQRECKHITSGKGTTSLKDKQHLNFGLLHRCAGRSFATIFIIIRIFAEMIILLLSTTCPRYIPLIGGLALRELSALAHVLDLRLRTLCHLPFALNNAKRSQTKHEATPLRSKLHFDAYSNLTVILIDIFVGVLVGLILFFFSNRSDFVLTALHRGFNILHMDVLTESTLWLMGVPAGLKLNVKLTEWLGTNVLAVLDIWNLVTTQLAAWEPTIVVLIGFCGALGSSFVLAVLVDLVHCVTAHILLIYCAFANVHAFMLYVISSLSYLFRGKKRNVLRNRVDTLICTIEQLLLGTLMFTMLVFLFPTFAVYYLFFLTETTSLGVLLCPL